MAIPAIIAAAGIQAAASKSNSVRNAIASILNAQNSASTSSGRSTNMGMSKGTSVSDSWGGSSNASASNVYGSDASARDYAAAAAGNTAQYDFMQAQMAYNAAEAEKNREFQRQMSNTSYQRAVEDLKKAGLNPILAAGNLGASTPMGAYASSGLATANRPQTFVDQESYGYGGSSEGSHSESTNYSKELGWSKNKMDSYTNTQLATAANWISQGIKAAFSNKNSGRTSK